LVAPFGQDLRDVVIELAALRASGGCP
jgi:hypothetical protein